MKSWIIQSRSRTERKKEYHTVLNTTPPPTRIMVLTADGDLLWHQELWPTSPPFSCFRQEPVANVLPSSRLGPGHFSKRDFWGLFSTANCFGSYQLTPPKPSPSPRKFL